MFDETTTSLGGVTHSLFNLSLDQGDLLPDGFCEERVQVDRRRLEAMITGQGGERGLPSAGEFFHMVENQSGAHVHWPSRLKIGAKTKKDPFVKIIGEVTSVRLAKTLILGLLKVKKERVTLKIEIPHASHSHIIGRKGRNTQDVMHATQCHIHFPDSNKHSDAEKNNQVSVAGPTQQVEQARIRLRQISPVILTITATVQEQRLDVHKRSLSSTDVSVMVSQLSNGQFQWTLKACENNELGLCMAIERIKQLAGLTEESDFHCRSNFDLRPALLQNAYGLFNLNTVRWIAFHTNTQMQFSPQGTCIVVLGQAGAILQARKYLMGLLPISLQFDRINERAVDRNSIRLVEERFGVQIAEKTKPNNGGSESAFLVRTHEANLHNAYKARRQLLKEEEAGTAEGEEGEFLEEEVDIPNDYAFMENFLSQTKQKGPHSGPILPPIPASLSLNPNDTDPLFRDGPDSPDPEESPIAHSLLASARSLKMNKGDLWRTPGLERQMNRERLLLKANRATYDPANQADPTNNQARQPTDLWSGFGFSNSLPADLLKPRLKKDFWNDDPNVTASVAGGFKTEVSDTAHQPPTITPELTKVPKGLASVREEEELSDYNQSNSSNLSSPLNRTANAPLQAFQLLQQTGKKPAFAASANLFEAGFGCSDISWDIRTFTDPAMVLAQLGCGEYLPQFREQEIDMPAFLLLDEQNLKDIGVSTLGARKKIFNAIIRLRESALTYGYRI